MWSARSASAAAQSPGRASRFPSRAATPRPPGSARRDLIARHAGEGMSSRQIAARLGIGEQQVREIAREHGITIPADAVLGRTRRHDANRIVRETARALEGLAMSVQLADPAGLDPAQATEWAASLACSLRVLSKFVRQMKEVTTQ